MTVEPFNEDSRHIDGEFLGLVLRTRRRTSLGALEIRPDITERPK